MAHIQNRTKWHVVNKVRASQWQFYQVNLISWLCRCRCIPSVAMYNLLDTYLLISNKKPPLSSPKSIYLDAGLLSKAFTGILRPQNHCWLEILLSTWIYNFCLVRNRNRNGVTRDRYQKFNGVFKSKGFSYCTKRPMHQNLFQLWS